MPTNPSLATKDPEILLNRIRVAFPDLDWKQSIFIETGWDHEVIQLDERYIFRFPNSPEYLSVLRDEIKLLDYLGQHLSTAIPKYKYVSEDYAFGGYAMLKGMSLERELFDEMSTSQQEKVAKQVAIFMTQLHAVDIKDLSKFSIATEPDFAGYGDVSTEAKKYLEPNIREESYKQITGMLTDIELLIKESQPTCLIHGDVAPKHIIWSPETEAIGVIDFSDRSISDPAYDFAELYSYGEAFVDKVYNSYQSIHKNDRFLLRAKAFMKAIGIHSLANSYRTDKIQRKEAERLLGIGLRLDSNKIPRQIEYLD